MMPWERIEHGGVLIVVSTARAPEVEALAGRFRVVAALVRLKPRPPVRVALAAVGTMIEARGGVWDGFRCALPILRRNGTMAACAARRG